MKSILSILIIFILFAAIDVPAFLTLNNLFYKGMLNKINQGQTVDKTRMYVSAIIAYYLMAIGFYFFIINPVTTGKDIKKRDYTSIFFKGMLFGLMSYGLYDLTNLALIKFYGVKEACIDMTWGSLLCGVMAVLSLFILNYFNLH